MNKKFITFGIVSLMAIVLVSAAILYSASYNVTVDPSFTLSGDTTDDVNIPGGESTTSEDLLVESQTSVVVPLSIVTTPEEDGITHTVNYLLDNSEGTCDNYPEEGWREECEKRLDFDGMALSEFDSLSMDVNVLEGYVAHVDVILDNGESLTFEYATFDSDCNVPSSYPSRE